MNLEVDDDKISPKYALNSLLERLWSGDSIEGISNNLCLNYPIPNSVFLLLSCLAFTPNEYFENVASSRHEEYFIAPKRDWYWNILSKNSQLTEPQTEILTTISILHAESDFKFSKTWLYKNRKLPIWYYFALNCDNAADLLLSTVDDFATYDHTWECMSLWKTAFTLATARSESTQASSRIEFKKVFNLAQRFARYFEFHEPLWRTDREEAIREARSMIDKARADMTAQLLVPDQKTTYKESRASIFRYHVKKSLYIAPELYADTEFMATTLKGMNLRRWLSKTVPYLGYLLSPQASHPVLAQVVKYGSERSRTAIALNPETPSDILNLLLMDKDKYIRVYAKSRLAI